MCAVMHGCVCVSVFVSIKCYNYFSALSTTRNYVSGFHHSPAVIPPSSSTEPAPVPSLNPVPHPTEPTGLERRVRSLEERVDRLTEVVVHRGASAPAQGNRFWYALTLAGWVMVPLIVVYMFHYKKTS